LEQVLMGLWIWLVMRLNGWQTGGGNIQLNRK
jgi:hypothetical protein